ncbi:MAG: proton-conducting membrane transporter [Oscillospiraceae bacterium]|nr:proton-conducting membrane transporter [Oscillospiraceae bacterium]
MKLILLALILVPFIGGLLLFIRPIEDTHRRNVFVMALCSAVSAAALAVLAWCAVSGGAERIVFFAIFGEDFSLALHVDGLSAVFLAIVAVLWPITDLYAFEYMQHDRAQNRFFAFFTMTYGVVIGIATAANLFTLYLFYEMLTLCTLPLVMHEMDGVAKHAGLKYLLYSMSGAAMAFLSMMILYNYGGLIFLGGGSLDRGLAVGHESLLCVGFLLGFFGFGVKAAVFPFHGWLPSAGVAPTPVTALLHAVAVVNAGIFAILRLLYFGYGASFLAGTFAQNVMLAVTAFTIVYGSTMALRMQHLKRRLAYSTVSNLSYMLLGAALCSGAGLTAAILHMIAHSALKIALFFCAGALLCRTEELEQGVQEYVFQYTGYAKKTPAIFAVFTIASLGLIGVPPLCGFASKWAIAQAAVQQASPLAITGCAALAVSAFLTGMYLLGLILEAYFPPEGFDASGLEELTDPGRRMKSALWACAVLGLLLIFFMPLLQNVLSAYTAGLM